MGRVRLSAWLYLVLAATMLRADPPFPIPSEIHPCGPGHFPLQLKGTWSIGLCCRSMHAWIRYENVKTGEVHTLSRFRKGAGDQKDAFDGQGLPPVNVNGLWWDQDLRHEGSVRNGRYLMMCIVLEDPPIYLGRDGGFGYQLPKHCCSTYAAEAWHFYTGERYTCGLLGWPRRLAFEIGRQHPEMPVRYLIGEE